MNEYLLENSIWLVPVIVAIISGVFGIIKLLFDKKASLKQKAKAGRRSKIIQIGGDLNVK